MVMSCLVEPLVGPLVGRRTNVSGRRTGLKRSRLSASALFVSAIMAMGSTTAGDVLDRDARIRDAEKSYRNAHKRPDPIPLRDVGRVFGKVKAIHNPDEEKLRVLRQGLAPRFEWDAIHASRLKHATDLTRDPGPTLTRARRTSRLVSSKSLAFLRFASGKHRSGAYSPTSV